MKSVKDWRFCPEYADVMSKRLRPGDTGFFVTKIQASIAGVFLEVYQNCTILNFRHKKSPSYKRKDLIYLVAIGGLEPPTPGL